MIYGISMNRRRALVLLTLLTLGMLAAITVQAEDKLDTGASSLQSLSTEDAARLSPMHQQMRLVLLGQRDQLADLSSQYQQATDSQQALEIQQRIAQVKRDTGISLLRIQAEAARAQGHLDDAERLDASIERLTEPAQKRGSNPEGQRPIGR